MFVALIRVRCSKYTVKHIYFLITCIICSKIYICSKKYICF